MDGTEGRSHVRARKYGTWLLWGLAAAAVFLTVSLLTLPERSARVLFDGLVPIDPYRWVRPAWIPWGGPSALGGTATLAIEGIESAPGSIATGDGQAVLVFPRGAVEPRAGQRSIRVTILPVHGRTARGLPSGLRVDGNVYQAEGTYAASGQPITLVRAVTVLLTYPMHAEQVVRRSESEWTVLPTAVFPTSQKVYAETNRLGAFAAASPPRPLEARSVWPYVAAAAAVLLGVLARSLTRRRARRLETQP